jgi:hypothetical protein
MKPLHEVNPLVIGQEVSAGDDDGITSEERTQLRELCVLIVISEFFESDNKTEDNFTTETQRTQS